MARPKITPFSSGVLRGNIYDFTTAGDLLDMHYHDEATDHLTIVARGSFLGRGIGWGDETYNTGDVIPDLPSPHEFEAKEPNSRLVAVLKMSPGAKVTE